MLYATMDWGLKDTMSLSPFSFSGHKDGKKLSFFCTMQDYDSNQEIDMPLTIDDYDFFIVVLANKKENNCVLLDGKECHKEGGSKVNLQWIAKRIKHKWTMTVSPMSTITQ